MRHLFLASAVTCCVACQTYTATSAASVVAGNTVRLTLTSQGSAALVPTIGNDVGALDGQVVAKDSGAMQLTVQDVVRTDGSQRQLYGKSIQVPADAVATIALKHVDVARSVLLAGGIVAGATLLATQMGHGSGNTQSGPTSPANPR